MTNTINNNVVYCTNDNKNIFISRDRGKSWQPVKDDRFVVRRVNGVITHGYVSPPSYIPEFASPDTFTHSSYSTTYPFAPFIKCNNNLKNNINNFQAELDALRALIFTKGARFMYDGKIRQAYDFLLKKMAEDYKNKVNLGHLPEFDAGWGAKHMRNFYMDILRVFTHPIGLKKAKMHKNSGMSNMDALKNSIANLKIDENLPKNFNKLSKEEQKETKKTVKKTIMQEFDQNPRKMWDIYMEKPSAVFKEMIESAGRANEDITNAFKEPKGLNLIERRLFIMSVTISAFNVIMADDPTTALIEELAINFVLFVGGFVGGAIGSAHDCKEMKGSAGIYCVVAFSLMGAVTALESYDYSRGKL